MRIPLMLFSLETSKRFSHRFRGVGKLLRWLSPSLDFELLRVGVDINPDEYRFSSLFSAFFYAAIFFFLASSLLNFFTEDIQYSLILGFVGGLVIFVTVLIVLLQYPRILSGKQGELVDKDLVYGLKDLLLSVSSGLSVFTGLVLVSRGKYGRVSQDIKTVVDKVNAGVPLEDALEELAISTPSEHFQNALWQIINTTKSGANVEGVLRSLVENLVSEQRSNIQKYSNELNVLTLVYMLAAVAIPTIALTLMIILNAFVLTGVSEVLLYLLIFGSFFIELMIIGFVKSRRPIVHV